MFFYIFTCFFIFFFRRLAAIKHFLLYRTDVFLPILNKGESYHYGSPFHFSCHSSWMNWVVDNNWMELFVSGAKVRSLPFIPQSLSENRLWRIILSKSAPFWIILSIWASFRIKLSNSSPFWIILSISEPLWIIFQQPHGVSPIRVQGSHPYTAKGLTHTPGRVSPTHRVGSYPFSALGLTNRP